MAKKPTDIKAEIKKIVAPKPGSTADMIKANAKGKAAAARRMEGKDPGSATSKQTPSKSVRSVSSSEITKGIEKEAAKSHPTSGRSDQQIGKALGRILKGQGEIMKGNRPVSETQRKKAEAGVISRTEAPAKRGRKSSPDSVRSIRAAKREAGLVKRGRPVNPENEAKRAALAEHRAKRAAEGKSSRGRKVEAESNTQAKLQRAQGNKLATATALAKPPKDKKGSKGLSPTKAMNEFGGMVHTPVDQNPMFSERGLRMRGKTAISYAGGGRIKFARRSLSLGKGKKKADVTVMRRSMAGPDNKFHIKSSYRQVNAPGKNVEEVYQRGATPAQNSRKRFTTLKGSPTKLTIASGRSTKTNGGYAPSSGASIKGELTMSPRSSTMAGVNAQKDVMNRGRDSTPHNFPASKIADAKGPYGPGTMRRSIAKIAGAKLSKKVKK